jgi:acetolactate synthase I/III small subunit
LVDVVKLSDLNEIRDKHIEREMMLIKIKAQSVMRDEINRLVNIFRGRIIDVGEALYTVELTGTSDKLDAFIAAIDNELILETVRSGVMGISRGSSALHV